MKKNFIVDLLFNYFVLRDSFISGENGKSYENTMYSLKFMPSITYSSPVGQTVIFVGPILAPGPAADKISAT